MTPDFIIKADSEDITAIIRDRFMELRVTDVAGIDSDMVEIRLDDRAPAIALPGTGVKLEVFIGYKGTALDRKGLFVVDEIGLEGSPDTMTIRARAADLRQGLKELKTRSFDDITIGDLVATIAAAHGYTPKVSDDLAGVTIAHLDQTNESDLHLLRRLAEIHGAVAKPMADMLLFVPKGQAKSVSGKDLPAVTKLRTGLTRWNVTLAERNKYTRVITRWRDLANATDVEVSVGSGDPVYRLRGSSPDAATATAAAKAKLAAFERGAGTISGTCPGDVAMAAEGCLTVSGVRPGVNGDWSLQQVVHVINKRYSCEFEGETVK
jgi:hypothetical protein